MAAPVRRIFTTLATSSLTKTKLSSYKLNKPCNILGIQKRLKTSEETAPTVRKHDAVVRKSLSDFGVYVGECLPKFVQKIQLTAGDELELLIAPEGVLPVLYFLRSHTNAMFKNITDIAGLDMPSRQCRFEVVYNLLSLLYNSRIRGKLTLMN